MPSPARKQADTEISATSVSRNPAKPAGPSVMPKAPSLRPRNQIKAATDKMANKVRKSARDVVNRRGYSGTPDWSQVDDRRRK